MRSIAFLRQSGAPVGPVTLGHVAWGIEHSKDKFLVGSLENVSGAPFVRRNSKNDAAYWIFGTTGGVAGAFNEMRSMAYANSVLRKQLTSPEKGYQPLTGYDEAIVFDVPTSNWQKARSEVFRWGKSYGLVFNNCLDNTFLVLYEYGTFNDRRGVSPQPGFDANTPKQWFAATRAFAQGRGFGTYYRL
jgi:hypothetical protein